MAECFPVAFVKFSAQSTCLKFWAVGHLPALAHAIITDKVVVQLSGDERDSNSLDWQLC